MKNRIRREDLCNANIKLITERGEHDTMPTKKINKLKDATLLLVLANEGLFIAVFSVSRIFSQACDTFLLCFVRFRCENYFGIEKKS